MSNTKIIHILSLCLVIINSSFSPVFPSLPVGTLVATSHGLVPVEILKVGDKVLSYDFEAQHPDQAIIEVAITKIDKHLADAVFTLNMEGYRCIKASPQQSFFTLKATPNQSTDISAVTFIQAQDITTNDLLIDSNMYCIPIINVGKKTLSNIDLQRYFNFNNHKNHKKDKNIMSINKYIATFEVYAIEVEEPHVFLVADQSCIGRDDKPHLLITHNGLPALGLGVSLAFGSTPGSISFTGVTASVGGLSAALGPTGLVVGGIATLGILGYTFFAKKHTKQISFNIERVTKEETKPKQSKQNDAQAPGKPTEEDGYSPPKKWDGKKVKHTKTGQYGWPDNKGKVWVSTGPGPLAHGGPHWDVTDKNGNHINIMPDGKIRGQK
jgi:hypothetical protein